MASVTCSLNITIPSTVTVMWLYNGSVVMTTPPNEVTQTGNTTTLLIRNPQPSDAGDYQCVFNDTAGYVLRRSITLLIVGKLLILNKPVVVCACVCVCVCIIVAHKVIYCILGTMENVNVDT